MEQRGKRKDSLMIPNLALKPMSPLSNENKLNPLSPQTNQPSNRDRITDRFLSQSMVVRDKMEYSNNSTADKFQSILFEQSKNKAGSKFKTLA